MTIRIYTGLNGSGKTLHCVQDIENYHKEFPDARIFTNITGLKFDYCEPLPASLDWHDTPRGSLIVYDEAQRDELFPASGTAAMSSDRRIKGIAEHRKEERDIWFLTPFGTGIHFQVRKYCREHYHIFNPVGLSMSSVMFWETFCNSPEDYFERQKADVRIWKWPTHLYGQYESAKSHKKKKLRIPLKVVLVLGAIAAFFCLLIWLWWSGKIFFLPSPNSKPETVALGFDGKPKEKETSFIGGMMGAKTLLSYQERFTPEIPHQPWTAPEYVDLKAVSVPLILCVSSVDSCRCYSEQMTPIKIIQSKCFEISRHGQYNPFISPYASTSTNSTPSTSSKSSSSTVSPPPSP